MIPVSMAKLKVSENAMLLYQPNIQWVAHAARTPNTDAELKNLAC